jgi:malonyl-CoA decarboxylase
MTRGGQQATGLAIATELVSHLQRLDSNQLAGYLEVLATKFEPRQDRIEAAIRAWEDHKDQESRIDLWKAAESPRQELLRRINMAPGGTASLVRLRGRLVELLPKQPGLAAVDTDLKHLFSSWFNPGFLQLREIDWQTSAHTLQQLIKYESVHEIVGWEDLRARLAADRRCFALFHPALPGEPLIFVEVALTRGLPDSIGPLINPSRILSNPSSADTAVFYSINNCQPGLRGISFGNFLIKQVVHRLVADFPRIRTFGTLSPIPGLGAALTGREIPTGFTAGRLRNLIRDSRIELRRASGSADELEGLLLLLNSPYPRPRLVGKVLSDLAVAYLTRIRRGKHVADSVAHFHLSNGARIERINPEADRSPHGRESFGAMVNYVYRANDLGRNSMQYSESGHLAMSPALTSISKRVELAWVSGAKAPRSPR